MTIPLTSALEPTNLTWEHDENGARAEWSGLLLRAFKNGGWGIAQIRPAFVLAHSQTGTVERPTLETAMAEVCLRAQGLPDRQPTWTTPTNAEA